MKEYLIYIIPFIILIIGLLFQKNTWSHTYDDIGIAKLTWNINFRYYYCKGNKTLYVDQLTFPYNDNFKLLEDEIMKTASTYKVNRIVLNIDDQNDNKLPLRYGYTFDKKQNVFSLEQGEVVKGLYYNVYIKIL